MNLTRRQQIIYFFSQHKKEIYNVKQITRYIYNNYFQSIDKTEIQLQNEICSYISKMIEQKDINFKRLNTSPYTYKYQEKINDDILKDYLLQNYNIKEIDIFVND